MHLIVDAASGHVLAAGDVAVPPEEWPVEVIEIKRPGTLADLRTEAAKVGLVLDLDDIQVDAKGAVIAVSRNRPLPPDVEAANELKAALTALDGASTILGVRKAVKAALLALGKRQLLLTALAPEDGTSL